MSKSTRNLVLTNFNKIFDLSTGFCSVKYWNNLIQNNCFRLIEEIHNKTFFDNKFFDYNFDFEENYFKLIKSFRNFTLFSICLHFPRCVTSCDKKANYCHLCSRVRENYLFQCNVFSSMFVFLGLIQAFLIVRGSI